MIARLLLLSLLQPLDSSGGQDLAPLVREVDERQFDDGNEDEDHGDEEPDVRRRDVGDRRHGGGANGCELSHDGEHRQDGQEEASWTRVHGDPEGGVRDSQDQEGRSDRDDDKVGDQAIEAEQDTQRRVRVCDRQGR